MTLAAPPTAPPRVEVHEVERRSSLPFREFWNDHALPHRPVIITDAMSGWEALQWTPRWFAERYPDKELRFAYRDERPRMREFIEQVAASSPENPAPYWTNAPLDDYFPELHDSLQPLPPYFFPNWLSRGDLHPGVRASLNRSAQVELYIGGPGGTFPLVHWDGLSTHAWLMQIHGVKQYWLWPPDDSAFMYPREDPTNVSLIQDVEHPDLETFPLFAKARLTTLELQPGELLFVPSRWWHTAKMLTQSITLSLNVLNASNWENFAEHMTRSSGPCSVLAKKAYLRGSRIRHRLQDTLQGHRPAPLRFS